MIRRLSFYESDRFLPYRNQAMEEYLLDHVAEDECILYLWQNQKTVVIGQNQNAWKELKVQKLEADGGHLARRLSGGGAVFHDLGNLNFTFLAHEENYDVDRQLGVILRACQSLGIQAEKTGRNDVTVDGRKFSGNAFYQRGARRYHHGTLMICVDFALLSEYLTVPEQKLKAKGVQSVKSRVSNLSAFCPQLTIAQMKEALYDAFGETYGIMPLRAALPACAQTELAALTEHYASWEWRAGRTIPFEYEVSERFSWGDITLRFHVERGYAAQVQAFSDAMQPDFVLGIPRALERCRFASRDLADAILTLRGSYARAEAEISDIAALVRRQNF